MNLMKGNAEHEIEKLPPSKFLSALSILMTEKNDLENFSN